MVEKDSILEFFHSHYRQHLLTRFYQLLLEHMTNCMGGNLKCKISNTNAFKTTDASMQLGTGEINGAEITGGLKVHKME